MKRLPLRRPSPALVISLVALFVALGGTGYAALKLPRNSVGPAQLRNKAVTRSKIRNNSIISSKVKNGSLLARDFKAGQLPAGPQGPQGVPGPQGPQGPQGVKGDSGATNVIVRTQVGASVPAGVFTSIKVMCDTSAGERAVGGGGGFVGNAGHEVLQQSYPVNASGRPAKNGDVPAGWWSYLRNDDTAALTPLAYVVCARA